MGKRKYKWVAPAVKEEPEQRTEGLDPIEPDDPEEEDEEFDGEDSDTTKNMRLIVGVLAHKLGINAVEPSPHEIGALLSDIDAQSGERWDAETLTQYLRKAQIELLSRQLGKE